MEIWLKKGAADSLLVKNGITRAGLAAELEISQDELNRVLDGRIFAGADLALLLFAAFGFDGMVAAIDWDKTGDLEDGGIL